MTGTVSMYCWNQIQRNNLTHNTQETAALVLRPPSCTGVDFNGALSNVVKEFDQVKLSEYRYTIIRDFSGDFETDIQSATDALQGRKIDTLVIDSHGNPSGLQVTKNRAFTIQDIRPLTSENLSWNLNVILMACDIGREENLDPELLSKNGVSDEKDFKSFARVFAERTDSHVYALPSTFEAESAFLNDCVDCDFDAKNARSRTHGIELLYRGEYGLQSAREFRSGWVDPGCPCELFQTFKELVSKFESERDVYIRQRAQANEGELLPCMNLSNATSPPIV